VTPQQALRFIERHGIVLESARYPGVPNLADIGVGSDRRGSWWGQPRGHAFFGLTRRVRASADVLVCRLVAGKVTYVHRRLWPAMVRLAPTIGAGRLASIREVHTPAGAHQVEQTPLRRWVSAAVRAEAAKLTMGQARDAVSQDLWRRVRASVRLSNPEDR
jgi:hypothetical protein